jgi:glycosyltransferase involved in cell wall biosynthesis
VRDRHAIVMVEVGGRGGVADYTHELSSALAAAGRPVTLVTARDHRYPPAPGVRVEPVVAWVRGTGAPARLVRRARLGPVANALRFLATLPTLARRARGGAVVHLQGYYFPPLAALLALVVRAVRVPLVYTAHGTFDRGRRHAWAHRVLYSCARTTIVHSVHDLPRLPPAARARAAVIPHGEYGGLARSTAPADPTAARASLGAGEDAVVALLFGQLRPDKGIGDLAAAAAAVPGVHVVVAGEDVGGLAGAAAALADPRLAGRVSVQEGFAPMPQVARLFAAADAVVLPYRIASQSGVLLLAYGFARPVVAYPVGGLPEAIVDGETGWLCARPDADALAETLRAVVAAAPGERARRGAAGRRLAAERWSWDVIARETAAVYDEASSSRTARE